ncbi:hypothetical protein EVAR_86228_1 [Eumeta japonica]|uniref:Uncharacterized protein n=1 Tax=Eumeta variegata TaxID=151549 RepID=A0A4C1UBP8_EUMVA|nr:hypothetical protein EVAR_86228_1 [Eumeta japonica]
MSKKEQTLSFLSILLKMNQHLEWVWKKKQVHDEVAIDHDDPCPSTSSRARGPSRAVPASLAALSLRIANF